MCANMLLLDLKIPEFQPSDLQDKVI
jgi:hypothetical protein